MEVCVVQRDPVRWYFRKYASPITDPARLSVPLKPYSQPHHPHPTPPSPGAWKAVLGVDKDLRPNWTETAKGALITTSTQSPALSLPLTFKASDFSLPYQSYLDPGAEGNI